MPDCAPATKDRKCGVPCTVHVGSITRAWYKHCGTGNVGTGATYKEARDSANQQAANRKILGIKPTGRGQIGLGPQFKGTGKAVVKEAIKKQSENKKDKEQGGSGKATEATPGDVSNLVLGSPEDWGNAIKEQTDNCFGVGIPCGYLVIGGLAVVALIMVLK